MPNYNANVATGTPLTAVYSGDAPVALFSAEKPAAAQASQQVALGGPYGEGGQHQCYAESSFPNGAPSAVSWKVQHAAVDVANAYTDIASATSALTTPDNILFVTSLPFIRIVNVTLPDQNITVKVGKK